MEKILAIRGSKEHALAIKELLGYFAYHEETNLKFNNEEHIYFVDSQGFIQWCGLELDKFHIMTYEEFKSKYPYVPGNTVKLKIADECYKIQGMWWNGSELLYTILDNVVTVSDIEPYETSLWLARNIDGTLYMYNSKPVRDEFEFIGARYTERMQINDNKYSYITWENSPVSVKLCI